MSEAPPVSPRNADNHVADQETHKAEADCVNDNP